MAQLSQGSLARLSFVLHMTNVLSERRPQQFQQRRQPCDRASRRATEPVADRMTTRLWTMTMREAVPEAEGLKRGFDFNGAHMCCQRQQLSYIMDIKCWPWEHCAKWAWQGACVGHNNSNVCIEDAIKVLKSRHLKVGSITNDISIGRWIKSHLQKKQNTEGNREKEHRGGREGRPLKFSQFVSFRYKNCL